MSDTPEQASISRRKLLKQSALALAGAGLYGGGAVLRSRGSTTTPGRRPPRKSRW